MPPAKARLQHGYVKTHHGDEDSAAGHSDAASVLTDRACAMQLRDGVCPNAAPSIAQVSVRRGGPHRLRALQRSRPLVKRRAHKERTGLAQFSEPRRGSQGLRILRPPFGPVARVNPARRHSASSRNDYAGAPRAPTRLDSSVSDARLRRSERRGKLSVCACAELPTCTLGRLLTRRQAS